MGKGSLILSLDNLSWKTFHISISHLASMKGDEKPG